MNLLSYDSPIIRFFERVFELIVINLLTLLLCLPLVTAGGAMTALYTTLFNMRQQKGRAVKGYFQAFKKEFKYALPLGLLCAAAFVPIRATAPAGSLPGLSVSPGRRAEVSLTQKEQCI